MVDEKNAPYNEEDIEVALIMTVTVRAKASVIIKGLSDRIDKTDKLEELARDEFKDFISNAEFEIIDSIDL